LDPGGLYRDVGSTGGRQAGTIARRISYPDVFKISDDLLPVSKIVVDGYVMTHQA